ncbi:MAG: hypothetical protein R2835_01245 [Thermomicrobiales bacterium]
MFQRTALAALVLITCMTLGAPVASHGAFSTSDYRVSWTDRWHAVQETETNLILSDGITYIHAVGVFDQASPDLSVRNLAEDWFTNVIVAEDVTEISPATALSPERANAIFTYRYRVSDQRLDPYAVYFEARAIAPGLLLWLVVDTHLGLYRADPGVFDAAVSSLEIEGQPHTSPPAQTFVSGPWQLSIPTVVRQPSIPSLGLSAETGYEWMVVIADIANGGSAFHSFNLESAVIQRGDGALVAPSAIDSQIVSATLRLNDPASTSSPILPNSSIRLALVYRLPEDSTDVRFVYEDRWLSLESLVDAEIGIATLPPAPGRPPIQFGVITAWLQDGRPQVKMDDGSIREISLIGTSLPALTNCFGKETDQFLQTLVGSRVAIEFDPAVLSTNHAYLWLDSGQGSSHFSITGSSIWVSPRSRQSRNNRVSHFG